MTDSEIAKLRYDNKELRESIDRLLRERTAILEAIDHTLSIHGHVDAATPLHDRIRRALTSEGRDAPAATLTPPRSSE